MKRQTLLLVLLPFCLLNVTSSLAQDDIRVNCGSITMSVPSTNVKCYQTTENSSNTQPLINISETKPDASQPVDMSALDPQLESAQIANIALNISDYAASGKLEPEVSVYSFNDLRTVDLRLFTLASSMTDILNNIHEGYTTVDSVSAQLPFLPYQAKYRLVNVLPAAINFGNGTGIRIITAFGDSSSTVSNSNLLYTMQAITLDGLNYVSAVIPVTCSELEGKDLSTLDWNSLSAESWNPSLSTLDSYMQSIVIQ